MPSQDETELNRKLVEAALFMAGRGLTAKEIMRAVPGLTPARAKRALEELASAIDPASSLEVARDGEESYKMKVKDEFLSQVKGLSHFTDLSDGEMKTLAIIAFYQPIRQSEIVKIRGNRAYDQVKRLVVAGLIVAEPKGVTKLLKTTDRFADYFGEPIETLRAQLDPKDKAIIDGQVTEAKGAVAAAEEKEASGGGDGEGSGKEEGDGEKEEDAPDEQP